MVQDSLITHRNDHIMANTWRLIFERKSRLADVKTQLQRLAYDTAFEDLLAEYRLIGLSLASSNFSRRYS
jgi:hypothetical protein